MVNQEQTAQIQNIESQVNALSQQQQRFQAILVELENTINALEKYKEMDEEDKNSFIPLGMGVLAKGVLKKSNKVFMNLSGIVVEKSIEDVIQNFAERQKRTKSNIDEISKGIAGLQKEYTKMLKKLRSE